MGVRERPPVVVGDEGTVKQTLKLINLGSVRCRVLCQEFLI